MHLPLPLNPSQFLWSILFLLGFWIVLTQAQAPDPLFARKLATLLVTLCVASWIGYEALRLHLTPHSQDAWFLILPKVLVFWIALCLLFKTVLFHRKGIFPVLGVCLTGLYLVAISVGLYITLAG